MFRTASGFAARATVRRARPAFPASRCPQRLVHGPEPIMNFGWIVLGLVGWGLGLVVVLTLFRMSGDQDRAARHEQKRLDPYSDVTITHSGDG